MNDLLVRWPYNARYAIPQTNPIPAPSSNDNTLVSTSEYKTSREKSEFFPTLVSRMEYPCCPRRTPCLGCSNFQSLQISIAFYN